MVTSGLGLNNIIFIDLMKVEQAQHMMEEVEAVIISPVIIKHSYIDSGFRKYQCHKRGTLIIIIVVRMNTWPSEP